MAAQSVYKKDINQWYTDQAAFLSKQLSEVFHEADIDGTMNYQW